VYRYNKIQQACSGRGARRAAPYLHVEDVAAAQEREVDEAPRDLAVVLGEASLDIAEQVEFESKK